MKKFEIERGCVWFKPAFKTLLTMKLIFLLVCGVGLLTSVAENSYAQSTKLTFALKNTQIKDVLEHIENNSEFSFMYENNVVDVDTKVDIAASDETIDVILNRLLGDNTEYRVIGRHIVLFPSGPKPGDNLPALSQQPAVSGTITDESGLPLPGVTVVVKGTTQGTVTNADGNYSLTNIPEDATLVFSFVGMRTQEVVVGSQTSINVTMVVDAIGIEEVVAIGYGTQKKANLTGAASSVKMEKVLANRPVTNPLMAIQGAVPGLDISTGSGRPGAEGLGINIRGITSIHGGSPLILLDNIPVNQNDINPQDVESVSVLKDAAATAIYGARAAFGVIIITTKKAKLNQPVKYSYSNTFTTSRPADIPDKASPLEFVTALSDFGTVNYWTGQDVPIWKGLLEDYQQNPSSYPEGYADVDGLRYPLAETDVIGTWMGDTGLSSIHNFSAAGGSGSMSFRVSLGYSDQDGIIVTDNDSYKKYNVNTYLNAKLSDKLTLSTNVLYRNSTLSNPSGNYYSAVTFHSAVPDQGYHYFDDGTSMLYNTPANVEGLAVPTRTESDMMRLFGKLVYSPIKGLNVTGEFTYEKTNANTYTQGQSLELMNPTNYLQSTFKPEDTSVQKTNALTAYKGVNIYADYAKTIGKHNVNAVVGFNSEEKNYENFWAKKTTLISSAAPTMSTATGVMTVDDNFWDWAVNGFFGRFSYNYMEKYLLEINGRYDASSKFPENHRWGFFPSFSAGWNISKESFLEDVDFLSLLKVRASWGSIGNQNVNGYYPAIPGMNPYNASWIDESSGLPLTTIGMPVLVSFSFTWEEVTTKNIGVDIQLFDGRLSSSFDTYIRETTGMIAPSTQLPSVLGTAAPQVNAADLETQGWELEMNWKDRLGQFSYNVGFTLYDHHGQITKYLNEAGLIDNYYSGKEFGNIWGYETDRFYTVDDFEEGTLNADLMNGTLKEGIAVLKGVQPNPGDVLYKDQDGDGIIWQSVNTLDDHGDLKIIGNDTRRYQFGVNGGAEYKNFDFNFLIDGVGKRDIWMDTPIRFPYVNQFNTVYASQLDYWTPENTDAYFARNYMEGGVNNYSNRQVQTKYLIDGSYLRLRNITLGYSMPKSILQKLKVEKLRIYIAGENLININNYPDGINTELTFQHNVGGTYPYMKGYSAGLNITF